MEDEFVVTLALPVSTSEAAPHHVSLFLTPKLVAAPDDRRLEEFRAFPDWGDQVLAAVIELRDQDGPLDCSPILDPVRPDVWAALFPPDTPVRSNTLPDWKDRRWRSFSAKTVHDIGKLVHLQTMYADPTGPPAPAQHPIAEDLTALTNDAISARDLPDGYERRFSYDERRLTEQMDEVVEPPQRGDEPLPSLASIQRRVAASDGYLERIFLELHRARRFYERPESQNPYFPRGEEPSRKLGPQTTEFHARVAMAGDHPALLRTLGLVIDLRVADPARLRSSEWLSASVAVAADPELSRPTRVRVRALADDSLVTVAETSDWVDGALALGDEDAFAVLDLEADGTALKAERFLWTLPRLLKVEENEDPVDAASPALRASGFTVARTSEALATQQQVERQHELSGVFDRNVGVDDAPALSTEDVNRGMRVEVWDDTVRKWFSLHVRRTDVFVDGHGMVLEDLLQEGFVQGTNAHETPGVEAPPVHVHEAMFGWEGWSLSAPRPGKRVRNQAGSNPDGSSRVDEVAETTPETELADEVKTHPIRFRNDVEPGTLPRLRFGRSYAFRVWSVDLAGNSQPHELNPEPVPIDEITAALGSPELSSAVQGWQQRREVGRAPVIREGLRAASLSAFARRATEQVQRGPGAAELSLADVALQLDPEVLARLRQSRGAESRPTARGLQTSRRSLVNEAVESALTGDDAPYVVSTAQRDPGQLGAVLSTQTALHRTAGRLEDALALATRTLTVLKPYLRWDPVPSPAVVPRARYTEGESLRVIVVRSGVTQDLETLELTVLDPASYAAVAGALVADLGYAAVSERHLAPPKTSQVQAEQHGMFDRAMGSTAPADHLEMLAWAVRENGSFFDLEIAHPSDPGQSVPQPQVRLEQNPGEPRRTPATLPLPAGAAPEPGQYVVHDVDELTLPYLPDPLADGVSLAFPEAGADRSIGFPFGTEGFTASYPGTWPFVEPFRLTLEGGTDLDAHVAGRQIRIILPAGDLQRFKLSSSLETGALRQLGPWRSMPAAITDNPVVAEAARDGLLWGLTPSEDVLLVHAVPRPLRVPRSTALRPLRALGQTTTVLFGGVDVHGPSTESVTAEARWSEDVDDLTLDRWETRTSAAVAFTTPVLPFEELALLGQTDFDFVAPGAGRLRVHEARHNFADTRHRIVRFQFRATTRFREYFRPELLAPGTDPLDDGRSVVGPEVVVSIPSSGIPAAPVIHSVLPLFRWSDGEEPEQPMGRRHTRRTGVRIYLERPWFSSGDGELLGVLLAPGGDDEFGAPPEDASGFPFVSKWAGDPVWISAPVPQRAMTQVQLDSLLRAAGLDDRELPGRPVAGPVTLPLLDGMNVTVLGYRPQYNEVRKLWYVDVAIDPATAFWPFLRLAVARYQPDSVPGAHLSPPVRADFVQLPPERIASVSRTDDRSVRVVLSGPIGLRQPVRGRVPSTADLAAAVARNTLVVASLQQVDPEIGGDLGWRTVAAAELVVRGRGASSAEVAWVGELSSPEQISLDRPGGSSIWRVRLEEWERFPGDPPPLADRDEQGERPVWEQRLVFADHVAL